MNKTVLIIIAIILPPLAVFLKDGAHKQFLINLVLFLVLPYIGGLIHALWFLLKEESPAPAA